MAEGEIVGHDNILSAARMNSAIVLFLKMVALAKEVVDNGVVLDGVFTLVLSRPLLRKSCCLMLRLLLRMRFLPKGYLAMINWCRRSRR